MPGNRLLLAAGLLAAFTAAVHTFAGTVEVHGPLLGSTLPQPLALLLYACWHLVTVALWLSAWVLLRPLKPSQPPAAEKPSQPPASTAVMAAAIGVLWFSFGVVFIAVALLVGGSLSMLLVLPQWVLLLPVGVLAWLGSRRM